MSAPLWTVAEVARALGAAGSFPDTAIDFVTQDSRLVKRHAERRLRRLLREQP